MILRIMLSTKSTNRILYVRTSILLFFVSGGYYDMTMMYNHAFDSSHHSFAFVRVTYSWEQKHGGYRGFINANLPLLEDRIAEPAILLCVMQILSSRESDHVTNSCCPPHCIRGQLPSCLNYPTSTLVDRWNLIDNRL